MILDLFKNKKIDSIPIWLMRQAGRYLPEYLNIRSQHSFLNLCYNANLISEVTLQPIQRFGFDAAIIFSDILVIPHALGLDVKFIEKLGPQVQQIKNSEDLYLIKKLDLDQLNPIYEGISQVREKLDKNKVLIGFVGAPFTLLTYIIEGKGGYKTHFEQTKLQLFNQPNLIDKIINILEEAIIKHLSLQIEAGVDMIQIFDSWAGILAEDEYFKYVIEPTKRIVNNIKSKYPEIPITGFPRLSGSLYHDYIRETNIDCVSIDPLVRLSEAKLMQEKVVVQGNLDPLILFSNKEVIKEKITNICNKLGSKNFIFNLGHGIMPKTPIENVEYLIELVKNAKN